MNALYSLYDALVSIDVPADKARAVVEAMERDMTTVLVTKTDLGATQLLLKRDIDSNYALLKQEIGAVRDSLRQEIASLRDSLRQDMELLRKSMTIQLGSMFAIGLGLLFAALKLT